MNIIAEMREGPQFQLNPLLKMNAPPVGTVVNVFEKKLLVPIFYVPHGFDVK